MTSLANGASGPAPTARGARCRPAACLSAVAAVLACARLAAASPYNVPADGGLREAVLHANASAGEDVIRVAPGTFTFHVAGRDEDMAARGDLDIRDDLRIVGAGSGRTIIDAGGLDRVFEVFPGIRLDLSGVTITGGVTAALFAGGGGILSSGIVSMTDTVVAGNSAFLGGGIENDRGTLTMTRSAVTGNAAQATLFSGGGIVNVNHAAMWITDSTVSENSAPSSGAGIFNSNTSALVIHNSTISGNSASSDHTNTKGGAIHNSSSSTLELVNTTVSGNSSAYYGGGVYQSSGSGATTVTIVNCTITGNRAKVGGGICNDDTDSTVNIRNTIVAENAATVGSPDLHASFTSLGYNLVGDAGGGTGSFLASDRHGGGGAPALDPMLGPLRDNGGPTRTHALIPGSPAIDAVPAAHGYPATDQRGFGRPYNELVDVGAFEVIPEPATLWLLALSAVALLRPKRR